MSTRLIRPGAAVGVLGSGQLGRMFAIAARRMGYRVHTLSPDSDTPTGQIADVEVRADYHDLDEVRAFASRVQAVTFEFENVPTETAQAAAEMAEVRPRGEILHITQHRLREKTFLASQGLPCAPFRSVQGFEELTAALEELGYPAVLKTAGFGYDGKGQRMIRTQEDAAVAWKDLGSKDCVLEGFIDFECELSVVAARGADGQFAHYGAVLNEHQNHILDITIAPAPLPSLICQKAVDITRIVLDALDVVGVLCVEFFLTRDGRLLINELAPRPHNSGHYTVDACVTSQFEQQLRAVCGLPLGSTDLHRPAAMANLLGDIWENGEPDWRAACAFPNVKLHLYGKLEPRHGRKMGHLTATAATAKEAAETVRAAREALRGRR